MNAAPKRETSFAIGLDLGVFAVKGVLVGPGETETVYRLTAGNPAAAAGECLDFLLARAREKAAISRIRLGLTGNNAGLIGKEFGIEPLLELKALQAGLAYYSLNPRFVLSLGHENMYYFELEPGGAVRFFNRNSQCAAGSGSFWYQQATRMGYDDRGLAEVAAVADSYVKISGRCAVFAKSDMTHAINEGASQAAVANGLAKALVDLVVIGVAQNRIAGPGVLVTTGGVANNTAIIKHLQEYCRERGVEALTPPGHEYIGAAGAGVNGVEIPVAEIELTCGRMRRQQATKEYVPENPRPPLDPERVLYSEDSTSTPGYDLSTVYLGVDCGSVSTKCALLDNNGAFIGGVYLPTSGRPALQVLALMQQVQEKYGHLLAGAERVPIIACTTGSGRFLAQKILQAEYAVDEITCQAEGVKWHARKHFGGETLSIIEIGGEDSKFIQIKDGLLYDYNMNPVCAAGTGTFLENLAEILKVKINTEFSQKAFQAKYAIDLGDNCTLLSQSTLVAEAAQGLPLEEQLASLAYSSARNYLSRTVENRAPEGVLVFTGATARNHALASALAAECGKEVFVPPHPELTGALGAALTARAFWQRGEPAAFSFGSLDLFNNYTQKKESCRASCPHEHNCTLDVITFTDGTKFVYGDRCGRYSSLEKRGGAGLPGYLRSREKFWAASSPSPGKTRVGIACGGLYHELYPFWAAFFTALGAEVVLSGESGEAVLEEGKRYLSAEMCYPVEVLIGHYRKLVEKDPDFIFLPEVLSLEPLPLAARWPRSSCCPLLQMIRGVVVNSLGIPEEKVLYAQLNYADGPARIEKQLLPVAKKLLGKGFSRGRFRKAVNAGYLAQENLRRHMEEEGEGFIKHLASNPQAVVALILGRSYTLYDPFVSKGLLSYAKRSGLVVFPQDYFLAYLCGWYQGRIASPFLEARRAEFERYIEEKIEHMDNIYPAQIQQMLLAAIAAQFFNERAAESGLPQLHPVLQDPFKCGHNSMLRHFLGNICGYLRLTLDEHTAPAGMITRLEAFKNTCRSRALAHGRASRTGGSAPVFLSSRTTTAAEKTWEKILIPAPTELPAVYAAVLQNYGVEGAVLPRSMDKDLTLARRYLNGEECLPLLQNVQDFLEYAQNHPGEMAEGKTVFFQGYACGPCRYGFYAQLQSLILNRAGYGEQKICAIKAEDLARRLGLEFVVTLFDSTVAQDLLYKMLHATRPYERQVGAADALFAEYCARLQKIGRTLRFGKRSLLSGAYLEPFEELLAAAAKDFTALRHDGEKRPVILLGGEFYVRLDDRCNQEIIRKIEAAGGEVSLAPASELYVFTVYHNYFELTYGCRAKKTLRCALERFGIDIIHRLALRDLHCLEQAAAGLLADQEEPVPARLKRTAAEYVSEHYGGEPPMTIGRVLGFAGRSRVAGAIFTAPFNCMPSSVVEAQQRVLSERLGIPITTLYYDGRANRNREEFIQSLVFQAKQKLQQYTGA